MLPGIYMLAMYSTQYSPVCTACLQNTPIWEESKATEKQKTVQFKLRVPPLTAFQQKTH